ncbi:hypothetical protein BS78_06G055000 [Paspalum vaginatum]|nr:hypothetical protein BS78_06G055000 [Paspalum vaginatum]
MAGKMAKVVLLLVFLAQAMSVLAAAARTLGEDEGDAGTTKHGWLGSGIGMFTQLLLGVKSRSNPRTHCC